MSAGGRTYLKICFSIQIGCVDVTVSFSIMGRQHHKITRESFLHVNFHNVTNLYTHHTNLINKINEKIRLLPRRKQRCRSAVQ